MADLIGSNSMRRLASNEATQREVAEFFGLSCASVHRLAGEGLLIRTGRGRYDLKASAQKYTAHLREVAANRSHSAAATASIRLKESAAALNRLKAQRFRDELIDIEAARTMMVAHAVTWRAAFLSLPSRIRHGLKLPVTAEDLMEKLVDQRLDELSEETANLKLPRPRALLKASAGRESNDLSTKNPGADRYSAQ